MSGTGAGGQAVGGDERSRAVLQMLQNNPSLQRFQSFRPQVMSQIDAAQAPTPLQSQSSMQGWKQQPANDLAPMQQFQQAKASPQSFAPLQQGGQSQPGAGNK